MWYNSSITKLDWLKYKRTLWIAFAVLFLFVLFFTKNKSFFGKTNPEQGLTYSNVVLKDLVNKDTDLDGIADWEESLWGTDPTKKETTPGIPDISAIEKLKALTVQSDGENESLKLSLEDSEKLTETDKFSRELFSTIATLTQNGAIDQVTVDKLSASLADSIKNSPPRKVFSLSDMKIIKDDSKKAVQNYSNDLNNIYKKYPTKKTVIDVLQKFVVDENNVDVGVLKELDPIIEQTNKIINALTKTSVPQSLSLPHLELINALQRLSENINDIKLYDTDVVVSLSAISQYDKNTTALESAVGNLGNAINQKLKY